MQKSPISILMELAQSKRITLSDYILLKSDGVDHCKTFTYQVEVNGKPYQGSGTTKQSAKTNCAKNAVDAVDSEKNILQLGDSNEKLDNCTEQAATMQKSPISILLELVQSKRITLSDYILLKSDGVDHDKTFTYQVEVNGKPYQGSGTTKQSAKTNCAKNALDAVGSEKNISQLQIAAQSILPSANWSKHPVCQINYVGQLNEFRQTNGYPSATYQDELPIAMKFCVKCCFGSLEARGVGSTKKEAKQEAAKQMLQLVRDKNLDLDLKSMPSNVTVYDLLDNNISEVIEKYKELSITIKDKDKEQTHQEQYERMNKNVKITTWDDLERELQKLDYKYTDPETLQTRPWVLFMTINQGTMMGIGDTRQEALTKMVLSTGRMLIDGYTFGRDCISLKKDEKSN